MFESRSHFASSAGCSRYLHRCLHAHGVACMCAHACMHVCVCVHACSHHGVYLATTSQSTLRQYVTLLLRVHENLHRHVCYTQGHMHTHMHMHTRLLFSLFHSDSLFTRSLTHSSAHTCTHGRKHTYTHLCTHAQTHTHMHGHTHTGTTDLLFQTRTSSPFEGASKLP